MVKSPATKPNITSTLDAIRSPPQLNLPNLLGQVASFRKPTGEIQRIHFVGGKGGGGKTATANGIISRAKLEGRSIEIYDLDEANPSLQRYLDLPDEHVIGSLDPFIMGQVLQSRLLPHLDEGHSVLGDLGGSGEIAILDFLEGSQLSEIFGETVVFHVVIGSLDSVGTALSIAERASCNPVVLYLNAKEPELRMILGVREHRERLEELSAMPNVLGAVDLPDLRAAYAISSRVSKTLFDAMSYDRLTLIERQICKAALDRIRIAFSRADAWLP